MKKSSKIVRRVNHISFNEDYTQMILSTNVGVILYNFMYSLKENDKYIIDKHYVSDDIGEVLKAILFYKTDVCAFIGNSDLYSSNKIIIYDNVKKESLMSKSIDKQVIEDIRLMSSIIIAKTSTEIYLCSYNTNSIKDIKQISIITDSPFNCIKDSFGVIFISYLANLNKKNECELITLKIDNHYNCFTYPEIKVDKNSVDNIFLNDSSNIYYNKRMKLNDNLKYNENFNNSNDNLSYKNSDYMLDSNIDTLDEIDEIDSSFLDIYVVENKGRQFKNYQLLKSTNNKESINDYYVNTYYRGKSEAIIFDIKELTIPCYVPEKTDESAGYFSYFSTLYSNNNESNLIDRNKFSEIMLDNKKNKKIICLYSNSNTIHLFIKEKKMSSYIYSSIPSTLKIKMFKSDSSNKGNINNIDSDFKRKGLIFLSDEFFSKMSVNIMKIVNQQHSSKSYNNIYFDEITFIEQNSKISESKRRYSYKFYQGEEGEFCNIIRKLSEACQEENENETKNKKDIENLNKNNEDSQKDDLKIQNLHINESNESKNSDNLNFKNIFPIMCNSKTGIKENLCIVTYSCEVYLILLVFNLKSKKLEYEIVKKMELNINKYEMDNLKDGAYTLI